MEKVKGGELLPDTKYIIMLALIEHGEKTYFPGDHEFRTPSYSVSLTQQNNPNL
jgi:hypothetical protein